MLSHQPALAAATLALGVTVAVILAVSLWWDSMHEPGTSAEADTPGKVFQSQAAGLVTLQGVVLTLVLTLAGQNASATIKVGGVALVVGVLLGLILAGLVALGVAGRAQFLVATLVFNLTVWACAYGLLCLASALVFER